jgi:hypothetical protein
MAKESIATTINLANALDLLSAPQIAMLAFGRYALFGDLHERAQPRPRDRVVFKQLRTVNAERPDLEDELSRLAQRDPEKVLVLAAYLKDTTPTLGAGHLAGRLEAAVEAARAQ